jgi:mRNA interferase MazF
MEMKQYDIVLVGLDPTIGAEMKKTRPCLVISPDEMNDPLRTIQVAPLTTNVRAYPWRVSITFQRKKGMVALDQIRTIDKRRVLRRLGKAAQGVSRRVKAVIEEMLVR